MQTLQDRLKYYCDQNKFDIPYGAHLHAISFAVIEKVKEAGKIDSVKKKKETMQVNNYPSDVVPIVDEVIKTFFDDKRKFLRDRKAPVPKTRYFNYEMEDYKMEAFESAAKYIKMEVEKTWSKDGMVQYRVPIGDPSRLIKLGKIFNRIRYQQILERRRKYHNRNRENNADIIS